MPNDPPQALLLINGKRRNPIKLLHTSGEIEITQHTQRREGVKMSSIRRNLTTRQGLTLQDAILVALDEAFLAENRDACEDLVSLIYTMADRGSKEPIS